VVLFVSALNAECVKATGEKETICRVRKAGCASQWKGCFKRGIAKSHGTEEDMDHPIPGLKYVDAKDLDDSGTAFAGMDVNDVDGEKLGEVEGFVMNVQEGRPHHLVVRAGWFIHKHFLLPIGHVTAAADGKTLVGEVTKERVKRFPGFDKSEFEKLDADEMTRLDATMAEPWAESGDVDAHYRVPGWWKAKPGGTVH
jgi:sporulation protein YlmC with PRC-barrel domain